MDHIEYLQRLAIEGQTKFNYFLIGLTFAILGLSLQTTHQVTLVTKISWMTLLVSGLVGVFRLEWDPSIRMIESRKYYAEYLKSQFEKVKMQRRPVVHQSTSEPLSVDELIKKQGESEKFFDNRIGEIRWKQQWRYNIQIWTFVLGVVGLAADKIFFN